MYQFLALIRLKDVTPLQDPRGNVTSHLAGLFYRATRLAGEHGLRFFYVFDGVPPALKTAELERRRTVKERYLREYREALASGDLARAHSKSTMTSRLTSAMIADAERLLALLGFPVVRAPGEAEAQAAFMTERGDAWAVASKDYDSLLFGAPRVVRFLTLTGREFLPSTGTWRPLEPELIDLADMLAALGLRHEGLIDAAILIGTDFNEGVKG